MCFSLINKLKNTPKIYEVWVMVKISGLYNLILLIFRVRALVLHYFILFGRIIFCDYVTKRRV